MNVLVIGGGGREHCLAWKISQSDLVDKVYAVPGNAGIAEVAECIDMGISAGDFGALKDFVKEKDIALTVVGPEVPLVEGIVDDFNRSGHLIFGPTSRGAMLEGSKVFAKRLFEKYGIPTPNGIIFEKKDYPEAVKYIENRKDFPVVVKADGLAAGKGVVIAGDRKEAFEAIDDCFVGSRFGSAGDRIIIEDFLTGYEVSMICFSDGNKIIPMALAQDYKRIFDDDIGKNTGGMGSYSPVPLISEEIKTRALKEIIYPTVEALKKEGISYRGILYAGILVSGGEPYLLEYNCRFGDPETQAVLPRLKEDIVPILIGCAEGRLPQDSLKWDDKKCICVIAASRGYPESSSSGDIISGLEPFKNGDDLVFHAGTRKINGNTVTDGGRVLGVVSTSSSFRDVRKKVYSAVGRISFKDMQFRKDIALKVEEKD